MGKNSFDDLELPEGVVEVTASVADDGQKVGAPGTPVSVDNEAEPAPASSDSPLEEDTRVNEGFPQSRDSCEDRAIAQWFVQPPQNDC